MAFHGLGAYILSDDFDSFWRLFMEGVRPLYTADGGRTFKAADKRTMVNDVLRARIRFRRNGWMFIDPATQFNPDGQEAVERLPMDGIGQVDVAHESVFLSISSLLREAYGLYNNLGGGLQEWQ